MKKGFTLIELLTVVLIVAVLTSIALPQYMRAAERSRATEAMSVLKTFNDAVYAYAAGRTGDTACPTTFNKLNVSLAGTLNGDKNVLTTRDFSYKLNGASAAPIPGTTCASVTATRQGGDKYNYVIWNPYKVGTTGKGASLACWSSKTQSIDICKSLNIYSSTKPY